MLVVSPFPRERNGCHGLVEFALGDGSLQDEIQVVGLNGTPAVQRRAGTACEYGLDSMTFQGGRDNAGYFFKGGVRIKVQRGLPVRRGRLLSWETRSLSSVSGSMRRSR
jgi:hypothetical protein